jgi:hypothetical protein
MKKRVTVATNKVDAHGDILMFEGIRVKESILITKDFEMQHVIGRATNIKPEGDELKADIELFPENEELLKGSISVYPAIGFTLMESEKNPDGSRTLKSIKLTEVSLCGSNVDPNVPPIILNP